MASTLRAWGLCLGGVLLIACGSRFEEEPGTTGGNGQGGNATASGGSGGMVDDGCPMGQRRAYPVPANWQGPMEVATSSSTDTLPDCAGNQATLHDGLTADPAVCPCSCDPPLSTGCRAIITNHGGDSGCTNSGTVLANVTSQCTNASVTAGSGYVGVSNEVAPGACVAHGGGAQLSEPQWSSHLRMCEVEAMPGPGGECLPAPEAPFLRKWCVVGGGDQPCPEGYVDKLVLYSDFDDSRNCSGNCSCDVSGTSCTATVNQFASLGCSAGLGTWFSGSCVQTNTFPLSYQLDGIQMSGACAPVPPTSTGEATPKNPATVCCTP